ncbi:MAG: sulfatase-like hydrolase/transferase [Phyllobacterium sp.]
MSYHTFSTMTFPIAARLALLLAGALTLTSCDDKGASETADTGPSNGTFQSVVDARPPVAVKPDTARARPPGTEVVSGQSAPEAQPTVIADPEPHPVVSADAVPKLPVPVPSLPEPVKPSLSGTRPNIVVILADDLGYSDIGAFGGEIETPNLDSLAARGRLLTNYHTGPVCAVTRAMLMSGTDHHLVGEGSMAVKKDDPRYGKQGYEDHLRDDAFSVAQLLRDSGYHTYMAGKWHLGNDVQAGQGPANRGFEHSFSWISGSPHFIDAVSDAGNFLDDGRLATAASFGATGSGPIYASDLYADKIISEIDTNKGDGKPFFAYLAFHAPHNPLQAPKAYLDKYKGRYDGGFDTIRDGRIKRLVEKGIITKDEAIPAAPKSWTSLSQPEQQVYARSMEIYAAMVDNLDHNVGRLIQHLKDIGELDKTFIVFHSDNGAVGKESKQQKAFVKKSDRFLIEAGNPSADTTLKGLDGLFYGKGWGTVSNAPFSGYKFGMEEGGTSSPTIVVLPGEAEALPPLRELVHVTDLAPTLLDLAGIAQPLEPAVPDVIHLDQTKDARPGKVLYQGNAFFPMTGKTILGWLDGGKAGIIHDEPLADEYNGKVYVRNGEWKALWSGGASKWALFDLNSDRGELTDRQGEAPDRLKSLVDAWQTYETRAGVLDYGGNWPARADALDKPHDGTPAPERTEDDDDDGGGD